ncbi:MAG: DUF1080 domain-containing protein [Pirellulales bacterium]
MLTRNTLFWLSSIAMICLFSTGAQLLNAQQAATGTQPPVVSAPLDETGFKPLFDGKSFDGWEGNMKFFRIEDSAIVAGNLKEKIPNNEFLCTEQKYENFELRLDAKLIGQGDNAGVQFRSERIPNHHEVIGYQCDIGLMGKDRSIWGALYDESRRKKFLAETPVDSIKQVNQGEWNNLRIIAKGDNIQIYVNGTKTVDYKEQDLDIAKTGIIGLQIHSGPPAEAWYRNVRIKPL